MVWYCTCGEIDVVWCGVVLRNVVCGTGRGIIWCCIVSYVVVQLGTEWWSVWCVLKWHSVVWCGSVVWYNMVFYSAPSRAVQCGLI